MRRHHKTHVPGKLWWNPEWKGFYAIHFSGDPRYVRALIRIERKVRKREAGK